MSYARKFKRKIDSRPEAFPVGVWDRTVGRTYRQGQLVRNPVTLDVHRVKTASADPTPAFRQGQAMLYGQVIRGTPLAKHGRVIHDAVAAKRGTTDVTGLRGALQCAAWYWSRVPCTVAPDADVEGASK